ncbi:MAG: response regulator, partial [Candidatus Hodarchaeota archaeon]
MEDEKIIAMDIQNSLENLGYSVPAIVSSGEDAIKKAAEINPDLILMDIRLEGDIDGINASEQIQANFNIPIIYLTAYADDQTLERAKITEPYGYILKPFEERELYTVIEMAFYKHKAEKKIRESEAKFRSLFHNANDMFFLNEIEEDGNLKPFLEVNKIASQSLEYTREELKTM